MNQAEQVTTRCSDHLEGEVDASLRRRVVILGGGFGGTYAALEFERILHGRDNIEVTLVTRDNYFLFTPMLHEVAASDLELSAIITPLRKLLRRVKTFTGSIEAINLDQKCVAVPHGIDGHVHELQYDYLIVALLEHEFPRTADAREERVDHKNAR